MPIPVRQKFDSVDPSLEIQVTDDGSRTLVRKDTGDAFHSGCGAAAETRHVYLRNSGVLDRLKSGCPCRVLEIGLGTGMGLLMTMQWAKQYSAHLQYVAIERDWVDAGVLRQISLQDVITDAGLVEQFLMFRDSCGTRPRGIFDWRISDERAAEIHCVDLVNWQKNASGQNDFDAVYFDPFAPDTNAEAWTNAIASTMFQLTKTGGKLVTYCVNRRVRDLFASVGYDVSRVPGPEHGKREVLVATKT